MKVLRALKPFRPSLTVPPLKFPIWQKKFSSFSERSRKRPSEAGEGKSSKEVRSSAGSVADSDQTPAAPVSTEKVQALKSGYIEIKTETDKISSEAAQTEFDLLASTPDGRVKISQIAQNNQNVRPKNAERAQDHPRTPAQPLLGGAGRVGWSLDYGFSKCRSRNLTIVS